MSCPHPQNQAIILVREGGEVARYAWPGGYPLFYLESDGSVLCPGCVQEGLDAPDELSPSLQCITAHGVNWEDPSLFCDSCSERIESAYAEEETQP